MSHWPSTSSSTGTVLVIGGNGFVAGFIVARLRQNGWTVRRAVRKKEDLLPDEVSCDLMEMTTREAWHPLLEGVDAIVNAAGILHETSSNTFETVHYTAPLALAAACVEAQITRFVQISMLGDEKDGEAIATKHRLDKALLDMELDAIILRPSIVYSAAGSQGSTSLLRALAGFPLCNLIPGQGRWPIQPVCAEDLGMIAAQAVDMGRDGIYEIGCQRPMSLTTYQRLWRNWMRLPVETDIELPQSLVSWYITSTQWTGRNRGTEAMWKMLKRGHTPSPQAWNRVMGAFECAPRSVDQVLETQPSQIQDRWHAQLYFFAPLLKFCIIVFWLLQGFAAVVNWTAPTLLSTQLGMSGSWGGKAALVRGFIDVGLGIWLVLARNARWPLLAMSLLTLGYTFLLGALAPFYWLDPLGGLIKNLVVLPALGLMAVLSDRKPGT